MEYSAIGWGALSALPIIISIKDMAIRPLEEAKLALEKARHDIHHNTN